MIPSVAKSKACHHAIMMSPGKDVSNTKQLIGTYGFKPCVANGMVFTTATLGLGKSKFKIFTLGSKWLGSATSDRLLDMDIVGKLVLVSLSSQCA